MTNKTINGVPRALLQRWLDNEDFFNNLQGQSMSAIDAARKEGDKILDELRALLNAPDPIVEADGIGEPVGLLLIDEYFDNREIGDVDVQLDKEVCERLATDYPGQSIDLYSADQLAALQSTIAQLKAENERLRGEPLTAEQANYENAPTFMGEPNPHHSIDWYREGISKHWKTICAQRAKLDQSIAALEFYAGREHYHIESGNWDTVSGEPLNILWCGDEPDFIEDGTVARTCLDEVRRMNP